MIRPISLAVLICALTTLLCEAGFIGRIYRITALDGRSFVIEDQKIYVTDEQLPADKRFNHASFHGTGFRLANHKRYRYEPRFSDYFAYSLEGPTPDVTTAATISPATEWEFVEVHKKHVILNNLPGPVRATSTYTYRFVVKAKNGTYKDWYIGTSPQKPSTPQAEGEAQATPQPPKIHKSQLLLVQDRKDALEFVNWEQSQYSN